MADTKIDVAPGAFASAVLEESRQRLVVVDFWAEWCGPCRTLGPVLERLAAEGQGGWLLAKVNVDQDPDVAGEYGIQGIPAVKAFRDSKVVDEFVGVIPEVQIRQWLKQLVPGPADEACAAAKALLAQGKAAEARAELIRTLELEPRHGPSLVALAGIELDSGDSAGALARLDKLTHQDADHLAREVADLKLRARQSGGSIEQLQSEVAKNPDAAPARMSLGWALAARQQPREALEQFLAVVKKHHRDGPGDEARKAMLEIFEAVGARSELADEYRTKLSRELYR